MLCLHLNFLCTHLQLGIRWHNNICSSPLAILQRIIQKVTKCAVVTTERNCAPKEVQFKKSPTSILVAWEVFES